MKATFKKAITGILAAAMCAVPMVSAMSASAEVTGKVQKYEIGSISGTMTVKELGLSRGTSLSKAKVDSVGYLLPETDPDDIPWPIRIRARKAYRITSKGSREVKFVNGRVGKLAPDTNPDDVPWWIIIVAATDANQIKVSEFSRNVRNKIGVVEFSGAVGLYTQDPPSWWVGPWPPTNPVADNGASILQGRSERVISVGRVANSFEKEASAKIEQIDIGGIKTQIDIQLMKDIYGGCF